MEKSTAELYFKNLLHIREPMSVAVVVNLIFGDRRGLLQY